MRLLNIFLIVFLLAVQTQCYIKRVGVNYALTGYKSRQSLRTVAISLPTASTIPSQPQQQQQQSINLERSLSSTPILEKLTIRVKNKVLNAWGCFFGAVVYSVTAFLLPFIAITAIYCDLIGENKRRKAVDRWINVWSWLCLRLSGGEVFLYGAQNLPTDPNEPVIYVPNHTSFLDIFALSGSIYRPFKYFSKSTILKIPLVGWGMQLAQHIFLDRHNPQSAIDSVSQCITKIKDGNSIVVFAEGTRSLDGRLGSFKNGAFRIADKTGARIVPVSIGNLFKYMPPGSIGPLSRIKNSYVMIHPPIDPKNKSVKELKALCYEAINSGLPPYQQSNFSSLESKE